MEDDRLIDCGGTYGSGGWGGGGGAFVTFNPRRPFNFYWNNNCIILPKSVDLPQVSASIYLYNNTRVRTTTMTDDRVSRSVRDHQWAINRLAIRGGGGGK